MHAQCVFSRLDLAWINYWRIENDGVTTICEAEITSLIRLMQVTWTNFDLTGEAHGDGEQIFFFDFDDTHIRGHFKRIFSLVLIRLHRIFGCFLAPLNSDPVFLLVYLYSPAENRTSRLCRSFSERLHITYIFHFQVTPSLT